MTICGHARDGNPEQLYIYKCHEGKDGYLFQFLKNVGCILLPLSTLGS